MNKTDLYKISTPIIKNLMAYACELASNNETRLEIIDKAWVNFLIEEKELIASLKDKKEISQYRSEAFRVILRNMTESAISIGKIGQAQFYQVELISRSVIFLRDQLQFNDYDLTFITGLDNQKVTEFYFNGKRSLSKITDLSKGEDFSTYVPTIHGSIKKINAEILIEEKTSLFQKTLGFLDKTVFEF